MKKPTGSGFSLARRIFCYWRFICNLCETLTNRAVPESSVKGRGEKEEAEDYEELKEDRGVGGGGGEEKGGEGMWKRRRKIKITR